MNDDELLTMKEIAKEYGVSRNNVYTAILKHDIPYQKIAGKIMLTKKSYNNYLENRYKRSSYRLDGYYTINELSEIFTGVLGYPYLPSRLYYIVKTGQIPSTRHGASILVNIKDAQEFLSKERGYKIKDIV